MTPYPAAVLVHWPTGPVPACVAHAQQLVGLGNFLGSHIAVTPLLAPAECENCRNEAPADTPEPITAEAGRPVTQPDGDDLDVVTHV